MKFAISVEWVRDRLWVAIGNPIGRAIFFGIEPLEKRVWLDFRR